MAAFVKMGDIEGEATDKNHEKWVIIESMTSPIFRTIPQGAKDQERCRGETVLGDIVVVRQLDKSSVKLQEACATGRFFDTMQIHFTTDVKGKREPYLKYDLKNVIITGYSFVGNSTGDPLPTEEITLGFTDVDWTYIIVDKNTGNPSGNVMGRYTPGTGEGG